MLEDTSFLEKRCDQILLSVKKLKKIFKWCLIVFIKKGKSIGRESGVNEEDIDILCGDIENIINQINSEFAKNKTS